MDDTTTTASGAAFLGDDFLLTTDTARHLFHEVAAGAPIIDVHNHLVPDHIADDRTWATLTEVWLGDDHYKWRAMRQAGFGEELVTGDADPWDRFAAWAATVPRLLGNPLYVWTHLELRRAFGIDLVLGPDSAAEIWDEANRQLAETSARRLLTHFDVALVATTDDPSSDLAAHQRHRASSPTTAMVPTYRPDAAHATLGDPASWNTWADQLGVTAGRRVDDLASLLDALTHAYRRFADLGCRASDHGLACLPDRPREPERADRIIRSARDGRAATDDQREVVLLEVVAHAARMAAADDAVLQLHLGPIRNVSPRLLDLVGRDAGADVMGDEHQARGLARFLGDLEAEGVLPRTVLYNLNPADNALFVAMAGAFARPGVEALVQWGVPWWFNDHEAGMRHQLDELAQVGVLAGFVGMLTDSRSILSMTRHELFRRVLCAKIGDDVAAGRAPDDRDHLAAVVRAISVDNAHRFFGLPADLLDRGLTVRVVVMGVSGSGKTTVGERLAVELAVPFLDADAAHPAANVAKMSAGIPLTDADRWPWLARLRQELGDTDHLVITCSALKRSYRDLLRRAGDLRIVYLDLDPTTARERVGSRPGHFAGTDLVASQFETLEPPAADETDVVTVDAGADLEAVIADALAALRAHDHRPAGPRPGPAPLVADGATDREITGAELAAHVAAIVADHIAPTGVRRVLLVPPDHTRLHSRAGEITALLTHGLEAAGCEVAILPAVGTHAPMTPDDARRLFGDGITSDRLLRHDFRNGLVPLGEIGAPEVEVLSRGRYAEPVPVEVAGALLAGWDLVVSVGQVVPHEVIGMANFTKNLVIGLGGAPTIDRSHFLGAVSDMEQIMGRTDSPVRELVDAAFDRFVAPVLDVLWVLTVMEATTDAVVQRGLFVGTGSSSGSGGAAYRAAAALAAAVDIERVDEPLDRVVCWLDPDEFCSTWLGNKAIYRTRMAIADGGELLVLAPGVGRFGEDDAIDDLIRRYGYRGTDATLAATSVDPALAASLGAAAHLIHGSTEDRFAVTYCTDPDRGGLTRAEVEGVGYRWRSLPAALAELDVDGTTPTGVRVDADGRPFTFIANPALGLWALAGPG